MASPFSQSQDWKYQCGTREALPSAQCMALLETNVELRRIVNLYTLWLGNTSTPGQHRRSSRLKKNSWIVSVTHSSSRLAGERNGAENFSWESVTALCVFLTHNSRLRYLKNKTKKELHIHVSLYPCRHTVGPPQKLPLYSDPCRSLCR